MNYLRILTGREEPLGIYDNVVLCIEDVHLFPDMIEALYREAVAYDEDTLDRFRFALIRLQIYADIHRYEDLEKAQKIKYVAQVLEKLIYGSLLMEHEELAQD
jgi:hypothetical protein